MTLSAFRKRALIAALIATTAGTTSVAVRARMQDSAAARGASSDGAAKSDTIPVTTKSAEARRLYEEGVHDEFDLLYVDRGIETIRQSVKADPHFAQAHAMLAFLTTNPAEGEHHRALARQSMSSCSSSF